jgi:hypothetical protein
LPKSRGQDHSNSYQSGVISEEQDGQRPDPDDEYRLEDSKKATKGEIVKQLDGKLRTYQYQQEILSLETWASYRINRPTAQIQLESAKKA